MTEARGAARLVVRIAFGRSGLRDAPVPVQVRLPSTALVARGRTGEPISVEPGEYLVTATLPGGVELAETVEVDAGAERAVQLAPPGRPTAPAASARWGLQEFFSAESADADRGSGPSRTVYLVLLAGNPLDPPLEEIGAAVVELPGVRLGPTVRQAWGERPPLPSGKDRRLGPDACELELPMPTAYRRDRVFWLRVTAPPDRARYVAVPAIAGESCTLVLSRPEGSRSIAADFHLPDPELDVLLQYRQSVDGVSMRAMLEWGVGARADASPVASALVAYATLRLGMAPVRTTDVVVEPSTLPDALLVAGELAARRGDDATALARFLDALDQGLPLFSDGMGWLSTRLPQYVRELAGGDADPDGPARLRAGWARLLPLLQVVDLKPVPLTLRGNRALSWRRARA